MVEKQGISKIRILIIILIILTGVSMYISTNNLLLLRWIDSLPILFSILLAGLIYYEFLLAEPLIIRFLNLLIMIFYLGFVVLLFRYIYYKVEVDRIYIDGEVIIVEEDLLGERYYYRKNGILKEIIEYE